MDDRWTQIDEPVTYYVSEQDEYRLAVTKDPRGWVWGIKRGLRLIASSMYGDEQTDKAIFYSDAEEAIATCQRHFDDVIKKYA